MTHQDFIQSIIDHGKAEGNGREDVVIDLRRFLSHGLIDIDTVEAEYDEGSVCLSWYQTVARESFSLYFGQPGYVHAIISPGFGCRTISVYDAAGLREMLDQAGAAGFGIRKASPC